MEKILNFLLLGMITLYQKTVSLFLPSTCRFYPSCSQYMKDSIIVFGPLKGVLKGIIRLSKCHPFHSGGVDLVDRSSAIAMKEVCA